MKLNSFIAILACTFLPLSAIADVTLTVGPTPIPRGDAQGARDITVNNGLFAVAFAVETAPPWGVARGGIVDIAVIRNGEIGFDIASLADFLPNSWTNWPTTYQRVRVVEQSAQQVVIRTERDWDEVELVSLFTIRADDSVIRVATEMTNRGDTALTDIKSGYVVWPDGGSMFGVPGLFEQSAASEETALADWTAAYGEHWALGLHAPYSELMEYGGQDRYLVHDLQPNASRSFEAWLQIENEGSLAPLVKAEIKRNERPAGSVSGTVTTGAGKPIQQPAVVAYKDGHPYAWTIGSDGEYEFELPVGDYQIYATAKGHSQGASRDVTITAGASKSLNFEDVEAPGIVHFQVADADSGKGRDARISIRSGPRPLIGYFGRGTIFTELDKPGEVTSPMAPGDYVFEISSAGGFTTVPQSLERTIESGKATSLDVVVELIARPQDRNWFSADLHHHSDVLDGNTPAEYVMMSELAAGVDITFLSDHDSVVNNARMRQLATRRGVLFMAGTEMSPSWAHFNAFPIDEGKSIDIDTGQSTVQEIFAAARRMGADVIEVNHPYMGYGYFNSREKEMVPGGYDSGYELVEIEASIHAGAAERNQKTIDGVWRMWNQGERKYLAAGSDAHDVWAEPSGAARTYVHVDGDLSIEKYVAGLKAGNAFASQGPLVYPEIVFGSSVDHRAGDELVLRYAVQAVSGLRSVQLISGGTVVREAMFDGEISLTATEFAVRPEMNSWYSLVIEDQDGQHAYSNPIWVTVTQ
jgi:hypothetical protein